MEGCISNALPSLLVVSPCCPRGSATTQEAEDRRRLNTKQAFKKSEVLQVEVAASSDRVHTQLKDNRSLTEDRHVTDLERSVRRSLLTEAEARNAKLKAQLVRLLCSDTLTLGTYRALVLHLQF